MFRKLLKFLSVILVASSILWVAGFVLFIQSSHLEVLDETTKTDAIVVLTGGSLRVTKGIELLEAGLAPRLFVSGVGQSVKMPELLAANGVSPSKVSSFYGKLIILGHDATDTVGNAKETGQWAAKEDIKSIRLVTAHYHMKRSLLEFRSAMPGVEIVPNPVFPDKEKFESWWSNVQTAGLLATEYNKFIFASLRKAVG